MFAIHLCLASSLIFGLVLLFSHRSQGRSMRLMALFMFLFAISTSIPMFYGLSLSAMSILVIRLLLTLAPILLAPVANYFFLVVTQNRVSLRQRLVLFVPPVVYWLAMWVSLFLVDRPSCEDFVNDVLLNKNTGVGEHFGQYQLLYYLHFIFFKVFYAVETFFSAIYVCHCICAYNDGFKQLYSNTENLGVHNSRMIFISVYALLFFSMLVGIVACFRYTIPYWPLSFIYLCSFVLIFIAGYSSLTIPYTAADFEADKQKFAEESLDLEKEEPVAGNHDYEANEEVAERLRLSMEQNQIYLQPSLTLDQLARDLLTNRAYLSRYINRVYGQSFSDYVNSFRIAHAKKLLTSDKGLTIDNVAERSGFSSYSGFYNAFRGAEGCSPSVWLKKQKVS